MSIKNPFESYIYNTFLRPEYDAFNEGIKAANEDWVKQVEGKMCMTGQSCKGYPECNCPIPDTCPKGESDCSFINRFGKCEYRSSCQAGHPFTPSCIWWQLLKKTMGVNDPIEPQIAWDIAHRVWKIRKERKKELGI